MAFNRKLIVEVAGDTRGLERSFSRASRQSRGFSRDIGRAGRGAAVATVGFRAHSQIHGTMEPLAPLGTYTQAQLDAFAAEGLTQEPDTTQIHLVIPLSLAFGNPSLLQRVGVGPLLKGLAGERQYKNDEQIDNQLRSVLFQIPANKTAQCFGLPDPNCFSVVSDLGAIDVARGRDHGIPTYNALRVAYRLPVKTSFTDITGNLQSSSLCVNALAIDPHIPRTLYAGTNRGVYRGRSNATGGPWVWEAYINGMPRADVRTLEVHPVTGTIDAATYGRSAFELVPEPVLSIGIDIKPGTSENIINIKSRGMIAVAILSSVTFDAPNEVNRHSLRFGRTGAEASLARCNKHAQDVNGDGLPDLVCHFSTSLTGFRVGDTVGFLKGLTAEGVPIEGSDAVRILEH